MKYEFKKGDKVKWFEDEYSVVPNYGEIVSVNRKYARVTNEWTLGVDRVLISKLNYN